MAKRLFKQIVNFNSFKTNEMTWKLITFTSHTSTDYSSDQNAGKAALFEMIDFRFRCSGCSRCNCHWSGPDTWATHLMFIWKSEMSKMLIRLFKFTIQPLEHWLLWSVDKSTLLSWNLLRHDSTSRHWPGRPALVEQLPDSSSSSSSKKTALQSTKLMFNLQNWTQHQNSSISFSLE